MLSESALGISSSDVVGAWLRSGSWIRISCAMGAQAIFPPKTQASNEAIAGG